MAAHNIWNLKYIVGNPAMFLKVTTGAGSPMKRNAALEGAQAIAGNGGGWRVWVEHNGTGKRIYESPVEMQFAKTQTQQHN